MKPSGIYVRARRPDGTWDAVDALELTEESFRRFVLTQLYNCKIVAGYIPEAEAPADYAAIAPGSIEKEETT